VNRHRHPEPFTMIVNPVTRAACPNGYDTVTYILASPPGGAAADRCPCPLHEWDRQARRFSQLMFPAGETIRARAVGTTAVADGFGFMTSDLIVRPARDHHSGRPVTVTWRHPTLVVAYPGAMTLREQVLDTEQTAAYRAWRDRDDLLGKFPTAAGQIVTTPARHLACTPAVFDVIAAGKHRAARASHAAYWGYGNVLRSVHEAGITQVTGTDLENITGLLHGWEHSLTDLLRAATGLHAGVHPG
jgi:hypothetical protein